MIDTISIYAEGKWLPPTDDVLKQVLKQHPHIKTVYQFDATLDRTIPCLVLGNLPEIKPITYVKTLSQKQIQANPAAVTELDAALNNLTAPKVFPPMRYTVMDGPLSREQLHNLGNVLVVDIETGGDFNLLLPQEKWLISLAINDGKNIYVFTEEALRAPIVRVQLMDLFTNNAHGSNRKLIAHNMKFDFRTLSEVLGVTIKGHLDTLLLLHVINPGSKEFGLKPAAQKFLGAPEWEGRLKEFVKGRRKLSDREALRAVGYTDDIIDRVKDIRVKGKPLTSIAVGYEAIPRAILYEYNAYDVYWTWYLYEYLAKAAEGESRIADLARFEFSVANFFQDVETAGLGVDLDYINKLDIKLSGEKEVSLDKIRKMVSMETFNPNSPKQVQKAYESVGLTLGSTAEQKLLDAYPTMPESAQKFTDELLEYRGLVKKHGTYVLGIQKRHHKGIVYPTFKVHGTNTGRMSSADPNVQNIPRDEDDSDSLRRIFVPRDGGVARSFVECDYSQAELRVMACMSGDEYLISLFQPGMPDFFDSLMPVAFPNIDLATLDAATRKNLRAKLKGVIYGLSYGRKEFAIAKALDMPVKDAKSIITNYFKAAPALYDWRMWVTGMAIDPERTLISPFGRYYQSELVTSRNKQNVINSGLAFLPQSTASDICLTAAMRLHEELKTGIYGDAVIVATIHDAILVDCPDEYIQLLGPRMQVLMEEAAYEIFKEVPFATEFTYGKSWEGI